MSLLNPESESDVRRSLLDILRGANHHAFALETRLLGTGAPDVNSADDRGEWWFECKYLKNLPQKFWLRDAPLRLTDQQMRPAQRVWHTKRWRAGNRRTYYFVVARNHLATSSAALHWYLLPGGAAAENLGRTWTLSKLERVSQFYSVTCPTPEDLNQCLF